MGDAGADADLRTDPPLVGSEVEVLLGFLDWHRATLLRKCEGLDDQQLATRLTPSSLTLGGLLAHLAFVEDYWCGFVMMGRDPVEPWRSMDWDSDPDADWHLAAGTSAERRQLFEEAVTQSRVVVTELLEKPEGLEQLSQRPHGKQLVSLRYVLVHLVEEYARHNGHADLIRESIDGSVGE